MTKITIINCIIAAVCVFQAANAGLFGNLSPSGPWDNINKQISNTLENGLEDIRGIGKKATDDAKKLGNEIKNREKEALEGAKKLGNEIENRGKETIDNIKNKITNGIKNAENELQNGLACTNVYTEGQKVIKNLVEEFNTCVMTKTSGVSENIKNLTNAISKIQADLTEEVQNILQCTANIMNITSCISEASQVIPKLTLELQNVVDTAYDLIEIFPNVEKCYEDTMGKLTNETLENLINNAKQCVDSVLQQFKLYL